MESIISKTVPDMLKYFEKHKKQDKDEVWEKKAEKLKLSKPRGKTWKDACEKYSKLLCEECLSEKGSVSEFHNIRLCQTCKRIDKYELICKTAAKSEYHLKDDDLDGLKYITTTNPNYKRKDMTLYAKKEIIEAFKEKYNIGEDDNISDKLFELDWKRLERGTKVKVTKQNNKQTRRNDLVAALNNVGLKLRNDSKLCKGYINGTLGRDNWTIPEIVNRMCQMNYLYKYCDMDNAFNKAKDEHDEELGAGYFPDEPLFDVAERIALRTKGGNYPAVWPWLNN